MAGTEPVNPIAAAGLMISASGCVAVRAVAVPESVNSKVRLVAAACPATGAGPESTPAEVRAHAVGSVPPVRVHLYGAMPPLPASVTVYAAPTEPAGSALVVIVGLAGTVSIVVPVLVVSATEVAVTVTVTAEFDAAGAVQVAPVVDVFDSVPPPVTVHETPSEGVLSFMTLAVTVTESVASTVADDDVTVTLTGLELLPQPERPSNASEVMADRHTAALVRRRKTLNLFRNINSPQLDRRTCCWSSSLVRAMTKLTCDVQPVSHASIRL